MSEQRAAVWLRAVLLYISRTRLINILKILQQQKTENSLIKNF